jgi:hypothetical protein
MIVAKPCLVALFSREASTTKAAVNAIGATMFPQTPSIMPVACQSLCRVYAKGSPGLSKSYARLRMFDYPALRACIGKTEHDSLIFAP